VLNPVRQAKRFDPEANYVRRYVPELEGLDGVRAHEPWSGRWQRAHDYPERIVDHEHPRPHA
jgi:deoxyribodipyrimidine photo-lyase